MIHLLQLLVCVLALGAVMLLFWDLQVSKRRISALLPLFRSIAENSQGDSVAFSADASRIRIGIFFLAVVRFFCLIGMLLLAVLISWAASNQGSYTLENYIALAFMLPMVAVGVASCALNFYREAKTFFLSIRSGTPDLAIGSRGFSANIAVLKDVSQAVARRLGKGRLLIPWDKIRSFIVEPSQGRGRYSHPAYYKLELTEDFGDFEIYRYYWTGRENELIAAVRQYLKGIVIINDNLE